MIYYKVDGEENRRFNTLVEVLRAYRNSEAWVKLYVRNGVYYDGLIHDYMEDYFHIVDGKVVV